MMKEAAVGFAGPRGMLRGIGHQPLGSDRGWTVMLLQGFFSSTHVGPARLYVQIARRMAAYGVEALRVDCFGVGDSDGDFEECSYESQLDDYRAILNELKARQPARRIALLGHSLGTSQAIHLAASEPAIKRLVLISPSCGPFTFPGHLFSAGQQAELAARGETMRKSVLVRRSFVQAIESENVFEVAAGVRIPVLAFRGAADEYYDAASTWRLVAALPQTVLVEIPGADHNYLASGARAALLQRFEAAMAGLWDL